MGSILHCFGTLLGLGAALTAQLHVAPSGSDAGLGTAGSPFRTINHAAAVAAPGSTIYVHAGTYGDEQGIVQLGTKDLVLQGDGEAVTIVRPHTALLAALPLLAPGSPVVAAQRIAILCSGPARIHLRDLRIDGQRQPAPAGHLVGIYARGGTDLALARVTITGCRPFPFPGTGSTAAIGLYGDVPTDPVTLFAHGSLCNDFGDAGLRAVARAELEASECRVAGCRTEAGVGDQAGVLADDGVLVRVRNCRITDLGGSSGAGIRCIGPASGGAIEGNRFARCAFGIDIEQTPAATRPGSVRQNRIAAVDTAVRVRGNAGLVIAGNTLHTVSSRDPMPAWDDSNGNLWQANRYPIAPGTPSVAIPGGTAVDTAPVAGISELQGPLRVPCAGAPVAVVAADFDGDGRTDFATLDLASPAVGISVGLWRPAGHVVTGTAFGGSGLRPVALAAGTFDAQPGIDLIALTAPLPPATTGAAFWVFTNNGSGGMTLLHQENLPGFVNPTGLASASFNFSPFGSLVVTDQGAPPFTPGLAHTFLNDGTGTVWFATPLPATFTDAVLAAAVGDVDGDAKIDVVVTEGSPNTGRVHWFRGNGIGGFTAGPGSPFAAPPDPRGVTIGDYDADGDQDVLAAATSGPLPLQRGALLVLENRSGSLQPLPVTATERGPTRLAIADLDADSFLGIVRRELLLLDPAAGSLALQGSYEPATGFAGGGLSTNVDGPVDFALLDADGDDFGDVIAAEPLRSGVAILRGSPTARAETFGRGCPGFAGREPRLEPRGAPAMPSQPNLSLQIGIAEALPLSLCVYAASFSPAPVLAPCTLLIATVDAVWIAVSDSEGRAAILMPVPPSPDLRGLPLCFQAGVLDAAATTSIFPGFSLTAGLRIRIGD